MMSLEKVPQVLFLEETDNGNSRVLEFGVLEGFEGSFVLFSKKDSRGVFGCDDKIGGKGNCCYFCAVSGNVPHKNVRADFRNVLRSYGVSEPVVINFEERGGGRVRVYPFELYLYSKSGSFGKYDKDVAREVLFPYFKEVKRQDLCLDCD